LIVTKSSQSTANQLVKEAAATRLWGSSSLARRLAIAYKRNNGVNYQYGTAGFRGPADTLSSVCRHSHATIIVCNAQLMLLLLLNRHAYEWVCWHHCDHEH
jgi:hypothetical protein